MLLSLAFFVVVAYAGRTHTFGTYSTETDFYHFYAPDAARLAAGHMTENVYQGPGYSIALALLTIFTGDLFLSGKWLSLVSAALVGLFAFLLFARLFNYWVGIGAQLITFASTEFAEFALSATTDMFFLMLCLACFVVFTAPQLEARWRVSASAVLVGAAYLTRYNGLFWRRRFSAA
ncbi:MAG: glycosyltransferase family 39 protein [Pyrinomonadaceae bacterium]